MAVDQQAGVHVQVDPHAIAGDGGHVPQLVILLLPLGAQPRLFAIGRFDIRRRAQLDLARGAVDDDRVAGLHQIGDIGHFADRRHAQRPRDDRHMAARPAILQHQAAQVGPVIFEKRRRSHVARHDNGVGRQGAAMGRAKARELLQQAIGQIVEIMQPFAQIGIGLALQFGARVVLHALDGRFGGQARTREPRAGAAASRDHWRTCAPFRARRDVRRRRKRSPRAINWSICSRMA